MLSWCAKDILHRCTSVEPLRAAAPPAEQIDECSWRAYRIPQDSRSFAECETVDAYNRKAWAYNRVRTQAIEELFKRLKSCGTPPVNPPPLYTLQLAQYIQSNAVMYNEEFRAVCSMRYLLDECKLSPCVDYDPSDAIARADEHAAKRYVKRMCKAGLIDITHAVGESHYNECMCENRWDGRTKYCIGDEKAPGCAQLIWKRNEKHHCLRPHVDIVRVH